MQALAGVRKQEAAVKAEHECLAERLRKAEADSTARVRQAVEVVEDLKVTRSRMPVCSVLCMEHARNFFCMILPVSRSCIWQSSCISAAQQAGCVAGDRLTVYNDPASHRGHGQASQPMLSISPGPKQGVSPLVAADWAGRQTEGSVF